MADTKISALPASTTPLTGTETLPIVQGGVTKKVSVANLTAGRAVATAGGSFTDNLVQGTAAKGVNFTANTPAAGMTSQLLNWYEEGTWTPELQFGGATTGITYVIRQATYTRTGRTVFIQAGIYLSSKGSATGDATIAGLPFTVSAGAFKNENGIVGGTGNLTVVGVPYAVADANSTNIKLNAMNNGVTTSLTDIAFANNTYFGFCLTYTV